MLNKKFKCFPKAGAIYVMEEAAKSGFFYGSEEWSNLGQGAPEVGFLENGIKRVTDIKIKKFENNYAPVPGILPLRKNIAKLYNDLFRESKKQKYSYENVLICGGGRLAISRIISSFNNIKIGYLVPDYTSYEGILNVFRNVEPICIELSEKDGFSLDIDYLKEEIKKNDIKALLLSNPSNPTGNLIFGEKLNKLVSLAKELDIVLILDEFYFNYIYLENNEFVSSAKYIDEINNGNVIIVSGLTKSLRYPGWRIAWMLGSRDIIENISSIGSFMDGGASHPLQSAICDLCSKENFEKETKAIKKVQMQKLNYISQKLKEVGLEIKNDIMGSFYIWASLENLPAPLNDGMKFFKRCLEEKVIVVPGVFFDLDKVKYKKGSRFKNYVRITYSSDFENIQTGTKRIQKVIRLLAEL